MPSAVKKTTATKSVVHKTVAKRAPAKKVAAATSAAADGAAAGLPEGSIKVVLRFHLKNLNTGGQPTNDDTVLGDALSDQAVAGMSAQSLFKALSRRDIVRNGGSDKTWPVKWPTESIKTLAPKLAG